MRSHSKYSINKAMQAFTSEKKHDAAKQQQNVN